LAHITGTLQLKNSTAHSHAFETRQVDVFEFELLDLGELLRMDIWHDNKGMWPAWLLDKIVVKTTAPHMESQVWVFQCGKWFDRKSGDKRIFRELRAERSEPDLAAAAETAKDLASGAAEGAAKIGERNGVARVVAEGAAKIGERNGVARVVAEEEDWIPTERRVIQPTLVAPVVAATLDVSGTEVGGEAESAESSMVISGAS